MRIDFLTLFPDMIDAAMNTSILGRGSERGHFSYGTHQIRDYTRNKQKQVDDYPYGGGMGLIMQADPLFYCLEDVTARFGPGHVVLMSPQGRVFSQGMARKYVAEREHIIFICGRYEGVDERFIEECVDEELSIGDYVLTGGEVASLVVADAVCRLIPGVLADESSFEDESHWNGLLEGPQYTRPKTWHDKEVPDILLSGDHEAIRRWRHKQAMTRTEERRPDLIWGQTTFIDV